jgi:hypothetical protein
MLKGIEFNDVQLRKQLSKLATFLLLAKSPDGTVVNAVQPLKQLEKLFTPALLAKS